MTLISITTYKVNNQTFYLAVERMLYHGSVCETERLMPMTTREAANYIRALCTTTFCRFIHIPLAVKAELKKVY